MHNTKNYLYKIKVLSSRLVLESFSHVATHVQASIACLNPKWIGQLCVCYVVCQRQVDEKKYNKSTKGNKEKDVVFSANK